MEPLKKIRSKKKLPSGEANNLESYNPSLCVRDFYYYPSAAGRFPVRRFVRGIIKPLEKRAGTMIC